MTEEEVRKQIEENKERFQLLAPYFEMHITPKYSKSGGSKVMTFGKYNSAKPRSHPFYKPYSKIIDFSDE